MDQASRDAIREQAQAIFDSWPPEKQEAYRVAVDEQGIREINDYQWSMALGRMPVWHERTIAQRPSIFTF